MQVGSLGWEDPLEGGMTTHAVFWPGEFHGQRSLAGYSPWGHKELVTTEVTEHACTVIHTIILWMAEHSWTEKTNFRTKVIFSIE